MDEVYSKNQDVLRILLLQAIALAIAALAVQFGFYTGIYNLWMPTYANRWLLLSMLMTVYITAILLRGLPYNHPPGENRILPALGWGNLTTLLRGFLTSFLAGFLFSPQPSGLLAWVPGMLYFLVVTADLVDGYLARITNHTTELGTHLDMVLDGLGILIAVGLVVQYGQAPLWYLGVGLARYLFIFGIWIRKWRQKPVYELPSSNRRRAFAGIQMGFLVAILFPIFSPPGTYMAALAFGLPFLASFLLDWLNASGYILTIKPLANKLREKLVKWIPLALRLVILIPLTMAIMYSYPPISGGTFDPFLLKIIVISVAIFVLLGIAGRTAAIVGLVLLGFTQIEAGLSTPHLLLVIIYTTIIYFGTGPLSLWTPEDRIIHQRLGETRVGNPSNE